MTFLAITKQDLSSGQSSDGYSIYFSPLPPEETRLPTVWLDLHIGGEYYQDCEDDRIKKSFRGPDHIGKAYVRIRPREGVRLYTAESIGLDCSHTAVITNTTRRAKHGLIVAPGRIDPGFNPRPLVLVVFNQSKRPVFLQVGEKVASIAFATTTAPCEPTESAGHLDGRLSDFDLPWHAKARRRVRSLVYHDYGNSIVAFAIGAVFTLLVLYLAVFLGIYEP